MNKSLVFLLLAGTLPAACNNKSPEQTPNTSATAPVPATAAAAAEPAEPAAPEPEVDPAAIQGSSFAAFDLLANRPLAHSLQGSGTSAAFVADAGAPSFERYIQGNHARNWKTGIDLEGRKASAMSKVRNATVWLPAVAAVDSVLELEVFNPAKQPNKLTVTANGTKLDRVSVDPGWQTVKVPIPAAAMRIENALDLGFASMGRIEGSLAGAALGKIRLGPASEAPIAFADVAAAQDALTVSAQQGGAMWHLWALDQARLKVNVEAKEACSVSVVWSRATGEKLVDAGKKELVSGENWVDLGVKDEVVRVTVLPPETGCEAGVKLTSAALVLPGEQPTIPQGKAPKQILFWMVDTLRADHLPVNDFETDVQAPNLKRLAEEGATFELAYVQGNESKTSHASLFSGMYPSRHGVLVRGHLKPEHQLLSEAMRDNAYKSYAFISNGYVSEPWGFVQGWDMYRNNLRSGFGITAEAMVGHTLKWMTKHKGESMFMYVGTIDPHVTYRKHSEYIGLYDDADYKGNYSGGLPGATLGEIATKKVTVTDREKKRIEALYKNEITYNDNAFGKLRKGLEEAGMWDDTMVVVTGDHGDQFWEHGGVGHGSGVHQELVHVPLIVRYPPLVPQGSKVAAGADVLDIYPTLLDAIDAEKVPGDLQGKSLLGLIHHVHGDYPEPAIATHYKSRYGVQMRQWKMISKKGSYQFFDRAADPKELTNAAGKHPLAERWLTDTFSVFRPLRDRWSKVEFGAASNLSADFLKKSASAE